MNKIEIHKETLYHAFCGECSENFTLYSLQKEIVCPYCGAYFQVDSHEIKDK